MLLYNNSEDDFETLQKVASYHANYNLKNAEIEKACRECQIGQV